MLRLLHGRLVFSAFEFDVQVAAFDSTEGCVCLFCQETIPLSDDTVCLVPIHAYFAGTMDGL